MASQFIKNISVIQIFAISLILIWIVNYSMNSSLIPGSIIKDKEIVSIAWHLPDDSKSLLPQTVKIWKSAKFNLLFSKFNISSLILNWWIKTDFFDWNKKYLSIYEIDWWLNTYLHIKNTVENTIKNNEKYSKDSKFEANNLWIYSFYYNNNQDQGTVFLVSLIKWTVFALEYPKIHHEEIKVFAKSIVDNL